MDDSRAFRASWGISQMQFILSFPDKENHMQNYFQRWISVHKIDETALFPPNIWNTINFRPLKEPASAHYLGRGLNAGYYAGFWTREGLTRNLGVVYTNFMPLCCHAFLKKGTPVGGSGGGDILPMRQQNLQCLQIFKGQIWTFSRLVEKRQTFYMPLGNFPGFVKIK